MTKISFIVPIYNVENYLSRCIESILVQNIDKEIILIDDGSVDSSPQIAQNYVNKFPYIYLIRLEHSGVSAARNIGINKAKGKYVMFVDSDDELSTNIDFNFIYQELENQNCAIGKGIVTIHFSHRQATLNPVYSECSQNLMVITEKSSNLALHSLPDNWFIPTYSCVINRDVLIQNKVYFNEDLSISEDIVFMIDLLLTDIKIIEFPYIIYHYHKRMGSITTSAITSDKLITKAKAIEVLENYITKSCKLNSYIKRIIEILKADYLRDLETNRVNITL
ncbi:MAG: glycosyltransferase [Pasteurella oralis]|uniref:glycosyltransferase n=1 Tax=Pasteurella oralis TaxID=1071947 RepID=UPI0027076F94|nr:glycosyltransferase [Pasteurella oralis]